MTTLQRFKSNGAIVASTTQIDSLGDIVHYLNFHEFDQATHRNAQTHPLYVNGSRVQASYFNYTISSRFQPIRNIKTGYTEAYEAFLVVNVLHGSHRPLAPLSAFDLHFDQAGITYIDRLARTVHTLNFLAQGGKTRLHLNVHPLHLTAVKQDHGRVFEGILQQCGIETSQVVLEVQEHAVPHRDTLRDALQEWQSKGYQIAFDKVGTEHQDFDALFGLAPNFIKLDSRLLDAAVQDGSTYADLQAAIERAHARHISVIATGIETAEQLDTARQLGVIRLQGFLLGRPAPAIDQDEAGETRKRATYSRDKSVVS